MQSATLRNSGDAEEVLSATSLGAPQRQTDTWPPSSLTKEAPPRPSSAAVYSGSRTKGYGPPKAMKSSVIVPNLERVQARLKELENEEAVQDGTVNSRCEGTDRTDDALSGLISIPTKLPLHSARQRPQTAPRIRNPDPRASVGREIGGSTAHLSTSPLSLSLTAGHSTGSTAPGEGLITSKPAPVQHERLRHQLSQASSTASELSDLPIPPPPQIVGAKPHAPRSKSPTTKAKVARVPGSMQRILSASEYVKSVASLLNPGSGLDASLLQEAAPNGIAQNIPQSQQVAAISALSNPALPPEVTNGLVEAAATLSHQTLEHAAMRVWWLEQNCKLLRDDAARQSSLAKDATEKAQRYEVVSAQLKHLVHENEVLRRALAELHANRAAQTEQLRDSILRAVSAQKKLIVEKNAELGQKVMELQNELAQKNVLLEERLTAVKLAEEERKAANTLIQRQSHEISELQDRLRRWEKLCEQEQSNAAQTWESARKMENEVEHLKGEMQILRQELEETRSKLAVSETRAENYRERVEDAERAMRELRLQLDREKDQLVLERAANASKTAELESMNRNYAQLQDQCDTLNRQLQRSKDEIEILRLRTAGSDKSFEAHRVQMAQLENQNRELKEAVQRRDADLEKASQRLNDLLLTQSLKEKELSSALAAQESLKQKDDTLQRIIDKLETDLNSSRARANMLEDEIKLSATRLERAIAERARSEEALRESEAARAALEASQRECMAKLRESMSARTNLETQLQSQGAELRGLTKQFIQLQNETLDLRSMLHAKTDGLAAAKIDRDRMEELLRSQIAQLDERQTQLQAELREAREELARVQGLREAENLAAENELKMWKRQLARRRENQANPLVIPVDVSGRQSLSSTPVPLEPGLMSPLPTSSARNTPSPTTQPDL